MTNKCELLKLSFEHAVMKLQSQREDLAIIRNRASIVAAMTGLIATFFATAIGSEKLGNSIVGAAFLGFSLEAILLFSLFAGSIVMSALVVANSFEFTFGFNTKKMAELSIELKPRDFFRRYSEDGDWFFNDNEKMINQAQNQLLWAIMLGFAQILPWLMLL